MISRLTTPWKSIVRPRWALLAIILITAALALWQAQYGLVGFYHDDGIYAANAKALAAGQGYRTLSVPGAPPQTKYSIFYPWLLSLVWRLAPDFPANVLYLRPVAWLCGLLFLTLTYRYLTESGYATPWRAVLMVLMTAASPYVVYYSSQILSEMPFALFSLATLYALEQATVKAGKKRTVLYTLSAGALASLAYLTRLAGLAIVAAGLLYLLTRRRTLQAALFASLSLAFIIPWHVWAAHHTIRIAASGSESYYVSYGQMYSVHFLLSRPVVNIVFRNIPFALLSWLGLLWFPASFLSVPRHWVVTSQAAILLLRVVFLCLPLAFLYLLIRRPDRWRLMDIYLATYSILILLVPFPEIRYWILLFPFGLTRLYGLCSPYLARAAGARAILIGSSHAFAGMVLLGLIVLSNASGTLSLIDGTREHGHAFIPSGEPIPTRSVYEATFDWIGRHVPPGTVLLSEHDPMFYLYTGRRGIFSYNISTYALDYSPEGVSLDTLMEKSLPLLRKYESSYLLIIPTFERGLVEVLRRLQVIYPGALELVFEPADHSLRIYKVHQALLLK